MNNEPIRLKCLSDTFISSDKFNSLYKTDWTIDKRFPEISVTRFLARNKRTFDFLDIQAYFDEHIGIKFIASKYSGVAPIFSPTTGKPFAAIEVAGSYNESFADFLDEKFAQDLLHFNENLPLSVPTSIKPPREYFAANFIGAFINFRNAKWRKFVSSTAVNNMPSSGTMWSDYASKCFIPANYLKFPNKRNTLISAHEEYQQLLYAAKIAAEILKSSTISHTFRFSYDEEICRIDRLANSIGATYAKVIKISSKDSPDVKNIKELANAVLTCSFTDSLSWRFDCAKVFERYVQFLFSHLANHTGARALCNPRISLSGGRVAPWGLSYLEPDMVIEYENYTIVVDAKYKSHMLNIGNTSDMLKETFRADLHQVLAYCNISHTLRKAAMLVYPFSQKVIYKRIRMEASGIEIYLIGLPIETANTTSVMTQLSELLTDILDNHSVH